MTERRHCLVVLAALVTLLAAAGCTNDTLDDGDGPDVILEVDAAETPPVTASLDAATGLCAFIVTDWGFTFANRPKNALATGPFNDIVLDSVQISYTWIDPALSTPTRVFGLGGVVVEADSSTSVGFPPIALDDLSGAYEGSTAVLDLLFRAHTIEGTPIVELVSSNLSVNSCVS